MSRVLRRPMFRGGIADSEGTGITSGLDNKYADGGRVGFANGPSYFPLDTYNHNIEELRPFTEDCNLMVTLGDAKTKVIISKKILLSLQLITMFFALCQVWEVWLTAIKKFYYFCVLFIS